MNILLVKLGALGDVLRTTPLLTGFRKKYPECAIDWVVGKGHRGVLENNPYLRNLRDFSDETLACLKQLSYDLVLNLDKEEEALRAVEAARSGRKMGFVRGSDGRLAAADPLSDYALKLGIDDELKFRQNHRTYQEISFEQAGLEFQGEEYVFGIDLESAVFARDHLARLGVDTEGGKKPVIGLNTGSGNRFAGTRLPVETIAALAEEFRDRLGATLLLLGGEDEIERNRQIKQLSGDRVIDTGSHSIRRFAAITGCCDLIISGDTTAMHIAIAMKVPVIATFGSTCAPEIELYGRGAKIVADVPCAPCYKKNCPVDEKCMKTITPRAIFDVAKEYLRVL